MLSHARENCSCYLQTGAGAFRRGDAADFAADTGFGLVTSTYDSLNHLESLSALSRCFSNAHAALVAGGMFVFDLNTIQGLDDWNRIRVTDKVDHTVISRGFFDRKTMRAFKRFSGFYSLPGGLFDRFEEDIFNTAFWTRDVVAALHAAGFETVYSALLGDLMLAIDNPEDNDRVFFVARKPHGGQRGAADVD